MSRHDQGRAARPKPTPTDTTWVPAFAAALRASGETSFTLDHPLFREYGVNESRARLLCHGSGGIGILSMHAVFKDNGMFGHFEWRLE